MPHARLLVLSALFASLIGCRRESAPTEVVARGVGVPIPITTSFEKGNNEDGAADLGGTQVERRAAAGGLGAWITTPGALPSGLHAHASAIHRGRLYLIGGEEGAADSGVLSKQILSAPLNPDGTVGAFQPVTAELGTGTRRLAAALYDGRLYVIGGADAGGAPSAQVLVGELDEAGGLAALTPTTALPVPLMDHGAVAHGGFLYVSGGLSTGDALQGTLHRAAINADGTLGAWASDPQPPLASHGVAVAEGYLHLGAGCSALGAGVCSAFNDWLYSAPLGADGSAGAFSSVVSGLSGRDRSPLVAASGALYQLGGRDQAASFPEVLTFELGRNGRASVERLSRTTPLPQPSSWHSVATDGGRVYLSGGVTGTGGALTDVVSAAAGDPGDVGPFRADSTDAAQVRQNPGAAVHNGYLYLVGGENASGTALFSTLAGKLGSGTFNTVNYLGNTQGRTGVAAFTHNGYLYAYGGKQNTTVIGALLYARLNAAGAPTAQASAVPGTWPARVYATATVYNDMLLIVGGQNGATNFGDLLYARISEDPKSIAAPLTYTAGPGPRRGHGAAAYGGYLYVLGGASADSPSLVLRDDVLRLQLQPDGTPTGTWSSEPPLPRRMSDFGTVVLDGYLYVVGGEDGLGRRGEVYRSAIRPDGSLVGWELVETLPDLTTRAGVAAVAGRIAVAFGSRGAGAGAYLGQTIETALVASGGQLTHQNASVPGMAVRRHQHGALVRGGRLFVFGGVTTSGVRTASVEAADLNEDGTVGAFSSAPHAQLIETRSSHATILAGDRVYLIGGGADAAVGRAGSVEFAQFTGANEVGPWTAATGLGADLQHLAAAHYQGRIYIVGGQSGSSNVDAVRIATIDQASGDLTYAPGPPLLDGFITKHCAAAYRGNLYVVGGRRGPAAGDYSIANVYVAPILGDGSLGAWTRTTSLRTARHSLGCGALDGHLYVFGGQSTANQLSRQLADVEVGAIQADGRIGSWTSTAPITSPTASNDIRSSPAVATDGRRWYVTAGRNDTKLELQDVISATVRMPPSRAGYSRVHDLASLGTLEGISLSGTAGRLGTFGVRLRTAGANRVFGPWTARRTLQSGERWPLALPDVRYVAVDALLDDSFATAVEPTAASDRRDLTQVQLEYAENANQLLIVTQPQSAASEASLGTVSVKLTDPLGNPVAIPTEVTAALDVPGGAVLGGPASALTADGVATFADLSVDKVGTYRLRISSAGVTDALSDPFTITPGPAAGLRFDSEPTEVTAGVGFPVTVSAVDNAGNRVDTFTDQVTVALFDNPGSATLGGTLAVSAIGGVADFSGLTLDIAGSGYTLRVSSSGPTLSDSTLSTPFNVVPGPVAGLAWEAAPTGTITAGAPFAAAVRAVDGFGNLVATATGEVTVDLSSNPATGTLFGTTTLPLSGGTATFDPLSIDRAGSPYVLRASLAGFAPILSEPFTVAAGADAAVVFVVEPTNIDAGLPFTPDVEVELRDSLGNRTESSAVVTLALEGGAVGASLLGTSSGQAAAGRASFPSLSVDLAATGYTLRASAGSLQQVSAPFDVAAGTAQQLRFVSAPSIATAGDAFTPDVLVEVLDGFGNLTSSTASITLALEANPTGAPLLGLLTRSASAGVATFTGLAIEQAGLGYALGATSAPLAGATSAPFDVSAAAPASLAFVVEPSEVPVGAPIAPPIEVEIRDAFGNRCEATDSIALALLANPGGAVLSGGGALAAVSGRATFPGVSLDKVGAGYRLRASSGSLTAADSATFTVLPGPPDHLEWVVEPGPGTAGAPLSPAIAVRAVDASGATATSFNGEVAIALRANPGGDALGGTLQVTAADGVATFSDLVLTRAADGYTLLGSTSGAFTSSVETAPFAIVAGPAQRVAISSNPTSCDQRLSLQVVDAFDNPVAGERTIEVTVGGAAQVTMDGSPPAAQVTGPTGPEGSASAMVSDLVPETVTATAGGSGLTPSELGLTFAAGAPDPFTSELTASAATILTRAAGVEVQVRPLDECGRPAVASAVELTLDTPLTATSRPGPAGVHAFDLLLPSCPAGATIGLGASVNGNELATASGARRLELAVSCVPLSVAASSVAPDSTSGVACWTADAASGLRVLVTPRDENGNLMGPGVDVAVDEDAPRVLGQRVAESGGVYELRVGSDRCGTWPVTVTLDGAALPPFEATFSCPAVAASSRLSASPSSLLLSAGVSSAIGGTILDQCENPAFARQVELVSSLGTLVDAAGLTDVDGKVSARLVPDGAGAATVTALVDGVQIAPVVVNFELGGEAVLPELSAQGSEGARPGSRVELKLRLTNTSGFRARGLRLRATGEGLVLREVKLAGAALEAAGDEDRWLLPELEPGVPIELQLFASLATATDGEALARVQVENANSQPASVEASAGLRAGDLTLELGGCGCTSPSGAPVALLAFALLGALGRRHRRM